MNDRDYRKIKQEGYIEDCMKLIVEYGLIILEVGSINIDDFYKKEKIYTELFLGNG